MVCPSNVIVVEDYPEVMEVGRCWHCLACVKECPTHALSLTLPEHIGSQRFEMRAWHEGKDVVFQILESGKPIEEYRFQVVR